jgi:hypothetical protein
MSHWHILIVLLREVHNFLSATVSDTLTVLVQVETLLASPVLTGLVLASLGHFILPVVFVFDLGAGAALERSMLEFGLMRRAWSEGAGDKYETN